MNQSQVSLKFVDGIGHITINEGEFRFITFSFGKVWFPDEEQNVMAFNYDIQDDRVFNPIKTADEATTLKFKQEIGGLLEELIREQLKSESVIYTGGI